MRDEAVDPTIVSDAVEAGRISAEPIPVEPEKVYAVHRSGPDHVEALDLEAFLKAPRRAAAGLTLHEADSLVRYVTAQGVTPATRLYGHLDVKPGKAGGIVKAEVVAILNDHAKDAPGWRDHRATLLLEQTPAWKLWHGSDRKDLTQQQFAELIEDGQPEIVKPDAADMLELAMTFETHTKVSYQAGIRLRTGRRALLFKEEEDEQGVQKQLPERFTLRLQVFVTDPGDNWQEVECRLRYKIDSGVLKLTYLMDRPELVVRAAFLDELRRVESGTKAQAVVGVP